MSHYKALNQFMYTLLLTFSALDLRLDGREFDYWPEMRERLRAGKPPTYFTEPPRSTQPPTLSGTENEHRQKCCDALRLGLNWQDGSFYSVDKRVGGISNCVIPR